MFSYCGSCEEQGQEMCPYIPTKERAAETIVMLRTVGSGVTKVIREAASYVPCGTFGSTEKFEELKRIRAARHSRKTTIGICIGLHLFDEGFFNGTPAPIDIVDTVPPSEA